MTLTSQTVHGYEIGERIGSGGYGKVYRATQLSVNRDVAIKVILPRYATNQQFVADFEAEAKLVAQLEHSNIVPLHDYWRDEQGAFLVMRYVRGGSLKEMLEKQGALSLSRTMRLMGQIAEALAAAHDAGVVHRDLKPANILIDLRGNAYLTDFGIAKQLTDDDISGESGTVKGTFAYMAPEQIDGKKVSAQTDVYALGIMLYEMLVGQHPFHDTPIGALLLKQMQEPLPDLKDQRDDLPLGMDMVIRRATAKSPTERYSDVMEMVNDLKGVVEGATSLDSQTLILDTNKFATRLEDAKTITPADGLVPRKTASTREERNRNAMLTNVRKAWVEGVLENSLHHVVQIELDLKSATGQVTAPWDTLLRTPGGNENIVSQSVGEVFDRLNGKLLILGDPGSGKTTTLLMLVRDLLKRAELDGSHPIPVVLNLSSWAATQAPLVEWMVEELNRVYQVPRNVGRDWVESDNLLLLLDGLDEVVLSARGACVEAINTYREEHGFVDVVVCSRIADYEALDAKLLMNGAIVIQPLNQEQVIAYFSQMGGHFEPIVQMLPEDNALLELCQSPLMVSIIALTYKNDTAAPPEGMDVETLRRVIFDAYVERAFHKGGSHSVYPVDFVRHQLVWLAQQMQEHGKSIFQIETLQPTWLGHNRVHHFTRLYAGILLVLSYIIWTFATVFTLLPRELEQQQVIVGSLLGGLVGVGFSIAISNKGYSRWWMTIILGMILFLGLLGRGEALPRAIFSALGFSLLYVLSTNVLRYRDYNPSTIIPVERLSFSWEAVRYVPTAIAILMISAAIVRFQSPHQFPERIIPAFLAVLAILTPFLIFLAGQSNPEVEDSSRPNEGMLRSIQNGLRMGIIGAAGIFLPVLVSQIILNDLETALLEGFYGVIWIVWWIGLLFGLASALQHFILRWMLHQRVGIPRNYAAFLDYASRLILLRRVGGSYAFIHRSLLEYFAVLEPKIDGS